MRHILLRQHRISADTEEAASWMKAFSVTAPIRATPEALWAILTDAPRWVEYE